LENKRRRRGRERRRKVWEETNCKRKEDFRKNDGVFGRKIGRGRRRRRIRGSRRGGYQE